MKNFMKKIKSKKFIALGICFLIMAGSVIGIFGINKTYAAGYPFIESGWTFIDDIDSNITYFGDGWTASRDGNYYNNTVHINNSKTSLQKGFRFNFVGTKIKVISAANSDGTRISTIKIDGISHSYTTYTTSNDTVYKCSVFSTNFEKGEHSVEVTTEQAGTFFVLDGIEFDEGGQIKPYNPAAGKNPVSDISLNKNTLSLNVGNTEALTAKVLPDNATNKNVTWSSSDTSIATVDNSGKVTGVKVGKAVITAKTEDGVKTATCEVTVTQPVSGVKLNKNEVLLNVGQTDSLIATVMPENASNKEVTWATSDSSICTVDSTGKITGVKSGSVTITVTTKDGSKTATCQVTVTDLSRAILTITMSNNERKEYDLSSDEVQKFVDWYNGNTTPSYKVTVNNNVKPFNSRTEYIAHDKVSSFEVKEYTDVQK